MNWRKLDLGGAVLRALAYLARVIFFRGEIVMPLYWELEKSRAMISYLQSCEVDCTPAWGWLLLRFPNKASFTKAVIYMADRILRKDPDALNLLVKTLGEKK